ncbi:MAG: Gfo/Idh/MocA family oxidoreductase [Bacteroidetes bacterium]|nr:Gfo/Idh/MocA family oxidoreductase [Bacteroidota bacterium]
MKKVGIIGFGYWGPNLVRNFVGNKNFQVTKVADSRQERLDLLKKQYPSVTPVLDTADILNDPDIDAVAIATPVFTHYELAKKALLNGKHVLLEKPMTATSSEAEELISLAEQKGLVLMVDHTFLYTGSVQKIKAMIGENVIGKVKYLDSTRINLGLFQPDINVLWDLAPHDISILSYILEEKPYSLNATGVSHTRNGLENIAYLTVNFESGFIAHFNCSWTSPVKVRLMLIGGDKKMIVFNDLEPTEKIKVYDTGYDVKTDEEKRKLLVDYRTGDIFIPKVPGTEALALMVEDFAQAVLVNRKPIADYKSGLYVIKILEASAQSLKNNGAEVIIK